MRQIAALVFACCIGSPCFAADSSVIHDIIVRACPDVVGLSLGKAGDQTTWRVARAGKDNVDALTDACVGPVLRSALFAAAIAQPKDDATLDVVSTATAALSGTYSVDADARERMQVEVVFVLASVRLGSPSFSNGAAQRVWLDASNAPHTFTITQFLTLHQAILSYVDSIRRGRLQVASGGTPTWPTQPVTIP